MAASQHPIAGAEPRPPGGLIQDDLQAGWIPDPRRLQQPRKQRIYRNHFLLLHGWLRRRFSNPPGGRIPPIALNSSTVRPAPKTRCDNLRRHCRCQHVPMLRYQRASRNLCAANPATPCQTPPRQRANLKSWRRLSRSARPCRTQRQTQQLVAHIAGRLLVADLDG